MEKNNTRFKKFKELDLFIQNSLDKYFYVEPWKKLYERTGKLHRDIISDKPTIPDLIIYNKTFNKSDCFIESNEKTFIKFPRKRFILRPKYKKEYNPLSTYGEDEVYFYNKKETYQNINDIPSDNKFKERKNINKNETFLKQNNNSDLDNKLIEQKEQINEKKQYFNKENEEDEEEEPEWANDNVNNYCNSKIEFKAIPKFLEDKIIEDLGNIKEEVNNKNLQHLEENNIDVDNFFRSNSENNLNKNQISNSNNNSNLFQEIKEFMSSENNEGNALKEESNFDKNNDNDFINDYNLSIEKPENINEHYNIFDTENKFNDIFIGKQKYKYSENNQQETSNEYGNNRLRNNSRFFNSNNNNIYLKQTKDTEEEAKIKNLIMLQQIQKQRENQQYLQLIEIQKNNNQLIGNQNDQNLMINQLSYLRNSNIPYSNDQIQYYNNQNLLLNNSLYNKINYLNNINFQDNNTNFLGKNNINYFPFNNNIQHTKMIYPNSNRFNKMNVSNLNYNNYNMNNVNSNNSQEIYVNNANSTIYRNNYYKNYLNNLNNNINIYQKATENNSEFSRLNNINYNNVNSINRIEDNIFPPNIWKNTQIERNSSIVYNYNLSNNINNKENNINNNINNNISKNYNNNNNKNKNEQKNSQKDIKEKEINENNSKYINPADFLENPTLIFTKNLEKKIWFVFNKDNSIIHNFNSEELLKFLEEEKNKNGKSLEEFIINDFETDIVFPAKEIYENLKNYYSN